MCATHHSSNSFKEEAESMKIETTFLKGDKYKMKPPKLLKHNSEDLHKAWAQLPLEFWGKIIYLYFTFGHSDINFWFSKFWKENVRKNRWK